MSPRGKMGRATPGSRMFVKRYDRLRSEGFAHDEAAQLAQGIISSRIMRAGRYSRRVWYLEMKKRGFTEAEIEDAVWDMYDEFDWWDAYSQFYPSGYMSDEELALFNG